MKFDVKTTIGLAVLAAGAGIGVTLAMLQDIQLRTDLFSSSASSPGSSAQVSSAEPNRAAGAGAQSSQAPTGPEFEVAQGRLNAGRSESSPAMKPKGNSNANANTHPDPPMKASAGNGPISGDSRRASGAADGRPLGTGLEGTPGQAAPGFDPAGTLVRQTSDASSGEATTGAEASSDDPASGETGGSDGSSSKKADAADASASSSGSSAGDQDAEASKGEGKSSGAGGNKPNQQQEASEQSGGASKPELKSLQAVDYTKMSKDISDISNALERFNQKLMKAIGQAKKAKGEKPGSSGEDPASNQSSSKDTGANQDDGSAAGKEGDGGLPELNLDQYRPRTDGKE